MNENLKKAIRDIEKVDGLMYAYEAAFMAIEFEPEEYERASASANTFYAIWDAITRVAEDLERLASDEKVVDVIYAVNKTRRT